MSLIRFKIEDYTTVRGAHYNELSASYQVFGQPLNTAPVVVVFHALTGNSDVCSAEKGWWKELIGAQKVIDLEKYTVIAFNILGNGYDGVLINNYQDFIAKDIAILTRKVLQNIGVNQIYTMIGGSLGGGIAWEYALNFKNEVKQIVTVAIDWKATDWLLGFCGTQEQILLNSAKPLTDARRMGMLFYRTPQSLRRKFNRQKRTIELPEVCSWLNHHGNKLESRFTKQAYLMMNQLLATIDDEHKNAELLTTLTTKVVQVAINTDLLFPIDEFMQTKQLLNNYQIKNDLYIIESEDGHDAFLIEHEQLSQFLKQHF